MAEQRTAIATLASIFLVLSTLTMFTRFYVRAYMIRALGVDDYIMVGAYLSYLSYLISQLVGISYGIGKHYWELDQSRRQSALECWWICEVFYAPATSLLKISVGFFLLRLTISKFQIWTIRLFIAGSMVCGSVYFLLIVNQCHPISFWWDLDPDHTGTCIDATAFAICSWIISVLNSTADLTFAIIPMFLVRKTTISTRTKVLVSGLLGIASVAGIVTIVRMPYLSTLDHYKGDFLFTTVNVAMLTTLEVGLGITAANLATLRPLVQRYRGTTRNTSHTGGEASRPGPLPLGNLRSIDHGGINKTTMYSATVSAGVWDGPRSARSESKEALNYTQGEA